MFKGTMTKWPVQKLAQGTTKNSYNIMTQQTFRKHIFLCFSETSNDIEMQQVTEVILGYNKGNINSLSKEE